MREPRARPAKLRVYVDTSVIGGCVDEEFREPSLKLMERAARGEVTLVVSEVTNDELEAAPPAVRRILETTPARLENIGVTEEVEALADRYIERGAIGAAKRSDAQHIAAATVAGADALVSWNFRHMVNLWRIRRYNEVNLEMGYAPRSPREIADEE